MSSKTLFLSKNLVEDPTLPKTCKIYARPNKRYNALFITPHFRKCGLFYSREDAEQFLRDLAALEAPIPEAFTLMTRSELYEALRLNPIP